MLLDVIERIVGAFEQQLRRRPGLGISGKADRAGDLRGDVREQERRPKGRANALAVVVDLRFGKVAVDEDAEFVAAQTRERDALVGDVLQPAPGLDEDLIPRDMAIDVVHGLEAVEIEDADDEALVVPRGGAQQFMQVGEKLAPVRQIGEDVEIGEARVLFGEAEGLQCLAVPSEN